MQIIDNRSTLLLDELKSAITANSKVYLACNYFTAFALFELIGTLKGAASVKVLLSDSFEDVPFQLIQDAKEAPLNLELDRRYRIQQVLGLLEDKFQVRKGGVANQNLLLVQTGDLLKTFLLTPANLDAVGLGKASSPAPVLVSAFEQGSEQYLALFSHAWNNSREVLNDKVTELLQLGVKSNSGESIYKYCIREIFHYSTISERADQKLKQVGLKDSRIWHMLYNFQKDAVIGAIQKIETYGGCIIADSVGLGKTFEALAVMKYYQLRNDRILVLAPKKLRENWTIYQLNDRRNILAHDRFNYDVLNHTDLSRDKGKSGDIDLEMINWGNYDLVVIDESHNFRNNPQRREGMTRYKRLMNDVIRANVRTKVLMLSATPVNNKMNDLKNQVAFITEGDDRAFRPHGLDSIAQIMREAQRKFTKWYRDTDPDKLKVQTLLDDLDGAYFKILDMLTIARSRKHIEKYYDMADIGKFPERLVPITVKPEIDTQNKFKDIGEIYDEISTLSLAYYQPLQYVRPDKQPAYEAKYAVLTERGTVFKQADREESLIYLMRVNLLKRLESSIHAFKLTIQSLLDLIDKNLKQLEDHQTGEVGDDIEIADIDPDDTELSDLLVGGKTKVLIQDLDLIRWKQDLKLDRDKLTKLMASIKLIDVSRDAKLEKLKEMIAQKIAQPINDNNRKVIVFTAFADTAAYLHRELEQWLYTEYGLYSALVTGTGINKTNMPGCKADLNTILTHFSPLSKKRNEIFPDETNAIDVLICTDCISEGQNLQDCDYLVNYDIHWNPVRIIQRFGRIDRIGSVNEKIQLVNFFPSMELDSFIDLVARVQGRMVMLDVSATGEDNIISGNSREMQDLEYRKRQLKQLQDQVMDMEDVHGNISITDLTFNDFKIDLEKSTDAELETLNNIPPASYAVVQSNLETIKPGVIFCLKDITNAFTERLRNNILYPYFLVYLSADGSDMLTARQTRAALDYFRKLCMGNDKVLPKLVAAFDKETGGGKKMEAYRALLKKAMAEVVEVQEEVGLDSLATPGGTTLQPKSLAESGELELVAYLVIK
ncbi:MAG: DEAD/DEAH box helicase family protein [Flavobacteriales bacterium]|nr:DEAD/DEAH box helicase family protein [Flavobacteriales bacterium]